MAAQYDFQRRPNPKGDGELQPLYPRIVNKGTIDTERLVSDISRMSSFSPGDIHGLLAAIEDRVSYYLSEGHHVQLGDMGYFSAGLQGRPVMDPKEIHAQTIFSAKYISVYHPISASGVPVLWSVPNMVSVRVRSLAVPSVTAVYWCFWRRIPSLHAKITAVSRDFWRIKRWMTSICLWKRDIWAQSGVVRIKYMYVLNHRWLNRKIRRDIEKSSADKQSVSTGCNGCQHKATVCFIVY